jgi:hypothetical protein
MNYNEFVYKYRAFFEPIVKNTPLSLEAALQLSYELTKPVPKILKVNNFFAVANKEQKKYKQYLTPFEGIKSGVQLIINNPQFETLKLGTLKANPELQATRIIKSFYND